MPIVYIGIGSNLGDRDRNCLKAVEVLKREGVRVLKQSSIIETEPVGVADQPKFMNMAIAVETELSPRDLLGVLKGIEKEMGRVETVRWGPRVIDLDILLYGDLVFDEPDLKIPHPLMHEREFVLRPLCEIAPEARHPVIKKTAGELLKKLTLVRCAKMG